MNWSDTAKIDRLPTGIKRLDRVLGGGFPTRSVNVVSGEPGAGKTVLCLQTMFEAARQGKKCIYFTTLSEPPVKLIRYMQLFEFFDMELLQEFVTLADLGTTLRSEGTEAALDVLASRIEEIEPDLVIVDSFKAIHDLIDDERRRTFVYELSVVMAGWGTTTLLVGEYIEDDIVILPEFAIADGIVHLKSAQSDLMKLREFEVRKLRGSAAIGGTHFFDITAAGIDFIPRVSAPKSLRDGEIESPSNKIPTGVKGLDKILGGGWPIGSTTLAVGGTGTGKTLLGLSFLLEGARNNEPGVFLALEEPPEQLRTTARSFGWDLGALEREGLLCFQYTPPIEISTDRFLLETLETVEACGAKRLVLDSLTSLSLGTRSNQRFMELIYALTKHLRYMGVSVVLNQEVPELLGTGRICGHGLSFTADNVLYARYVEENGQLDRALTVIKSRGTQHSTRLYSLEISQEEGVTVGEPLENLFGVLSGTPTSG